LATDSSQVTLSEVKTTKTEAITADFLTFQSLELQKQGFRPGYNLIVIVVSPVPNFSFVNADGSAIVGMTNTQNHRASLIRSFSKAEIDSLMTGQGLQDGVVLTLQ
jgi:hypothetical protein